MLLMLRYYFFFSQTDLDEKVAQISRLHQQLVGQVIDSHFSIILYLFTGYVGHIVYGMVLAMVVTAMVKITFSSVVFMLLYLIKYM